MSEWSYKTLDQMGTISRGKSKHRPRNDARLFGGKYPFIQTGDIGAAELYVTEYSQTYNEEGLAQSKLWDKDTLCITIAANIADTALLAFPACFPDSIMGFVPFKEVADVKFVKYCFDILQKDCQQISQGTAQDNLSWEKLSTIMFPCPPIEIQHRIAAILSRYDTLIENYQKQIKLLEEAAQRLYKEWFVDLRFPGYENVKMVDGLPEGWERKRLGDITCKFATGLNPRKNFVLGRGNNYYVTIKNMSNNDVIFDERCDKVDDEALEKINKRSDLQMGDLLFSGIGTIGRVYLIDKPVKDWNISESVFTMRPNVDIPSTFLYLTLLDKEIQDYCQSNAHGCAQKGIRMADLKAFEIKLPSAAILSVFSEIVTPMIKQVKSKTSQIRLLTEARDRLLPRLMGGEMEVKEQM
jgi:type I restriction enzyme S subunit